MVKMQFDLSDAEQTPVFKFMLESIRDFVVCLLNHGFDNGISGDFTARLCPMFSDKIALNGYNIIQIDSSFLKKIIISTNYICDEVREMTDVSLETLFDSIENKKKAFVERLLDVDNEWNALEERYKTHMPEENMNVILGCIEFFIMHEITHSIYRDKGLDPKDEELKCDNSAAQIVKKLIQGALLNKDMTAAKNMFLGSLVACFHLAEVVLEDTDVERDSDTHPPSYQRTSAVINELESLSPPDAFYSLPLYYFALIYRCNCEEILKQEYSYKDALDTLLRYSAKDK